MGSYVKGMRIIRSSKHTSALEAAAIERERYGCTIPKGAKFSLKSEVEEPRPLTEKEVEDEVDRAWFFDLPDEVIKLAKSVSDWSKREWQDWDLCSEFSTLSVAIGATKTADKAVRVAGNLQEG